MDTAKQCCYFGFDVQADASLFLHDNKSCVTCSAYQIENGDNAVSAYFLDKTRIAQAVTVPAEWIISHIYLVIEILRKISKTPFCCK